MSTKTSLLLFNLPLNGLIFAFFFTFCLSFFVGYEFVIFIVCISGVLIYSKRLVTRSVVLPITNLWLFPKLAIRNAPKGFLEQIDNDIYNNCKVLIGAPPQPILRHCLAKYIQARFGEVEFVDSGSLTLGTQRLTTELRTITESSGKKLASTVDNYRKRGWLEHGSVTKVKGFLNSRFTQTLRYSVN